DMPTLENVTVPALARNIEALRKLPKLKRLAFSEKTAFSPDEQTRKYYQSVSSMLSEAQKQEQGSNNSLDQNTLLRRAQLFGVDGRFSPTTPATTAEEFWKEYSTLSWLSRLRDSASKPSVISRLSDGTWELSFDNNKEFNDLTLLHGIPISDLSF